LALIVQDSGQKEGTVGKEMEILPIFYRAWFPSHMIGKFENNFEFSQIEKCDLEALEMKLFVCFVVFFLANV
jgi:hypothetical protein